MSFHHLLVSEIPFMQHGCIPGECKAYSSIGTQKRSHVQSCCGWQDFRSSFPWLHIGQDCGKLDTLAPDDETLLLARHRCLRLAGALCMCNGKMGSDSKLAEKV